MTDVIYRVVFKGEAAQGQTIDDVKNRLGALLKKDAASIERYFSGKTIVLKKEGSLEECKKIKQAFTRAGAVCHVEPINTPTPDGDITLMFQKNTRPPDQDDKQPPPLPKRPDPEASKTAKRADEKFCESCGEIIKINALACPYCGKKMKKSGSMPGCAVAAIVFVVFIFVVGLLAAIAIPQFTAYRNRAYQETVKLELREIKQSESEFFLVYKKYTSDLADLDVTIEDPKVTIEILNADADCFEAKGTRTGLRKNFLINCHGNEWESDKTSNN